jgi:hypothetical protein
MSNVNKYEKVKLKINFRFIEVLVNMTLWRGFIDFKNFIKTQAKLNVVLSRF